MKKKADAFSRRNFLTGASFGSAGIAATGLIGAMPTGARAADLSALQQKLNTDPALRNEFIKDPGAVLSKNGIDIDQKQLDALKNQLSKTDTQRASEDVSVGITVGN